MALAADNSYQITDQLYPPKLLMNNITVNSLTLSAIEEGEILFTEIPDSGKISPSVSVCALSSSAKTLACSDELSFSPVVSIPYYFCNFCSKHTDSKTALLQHVLQKHLFVCKLCHFLALTRYSLIQHQFQKHAGAKEMQFYCNTQALHIRTPELQQCLQPMSQHLDNSSSSHIQCNGAKLHTVNQVGISSQRLSTEALENSIQLLIRKPDSDVDHLNAGHSKITDAENTDVSSKTHESNKMLNILTRLVKSIFNQTESTGNLESAKKRPSCISDAHDRKPTPKKLKTDFHTNSTESSQSSSCGMPHFLDQSSSDVISSSTSEIIKSLSHLQKNHILTCQQLDMGKNNENDLKCLLPHYLTEPLLLSESVKCINSEAGTKNSSFLKTNTLRKILQRRDVEDNYEQCDVSESQEGSGQSASNVLSPTSGIPLKEVSSSFQIHQYKADEFNSSSALAFLSGEKLQKQFEEVMSKSPGFSFLDSSQERQALSDNSYINHEKCKNQKVTPISLSEVSNMNDGFFSDISHTQTDSDSKYLRYQETHNFEHFLTTPEDMLKYTKPPKEDFWPPLHGNVEKDSTNCNQDMETSLNTGEGERYDTLRRLLVCRASEVTNEPRQLKASCRVKRTPLNPDEGDRDHSFQKLVQGAAEVNKGDQLQFLTSATSQQVSSENLTKFGSSKSLTRASDMTLQEILTQNVSTLTLPSPTLMSQSIFLVCGYCNFESSDKFHFQRHVEKCRYARLSADIVEPQSYCESKPADDMKSEPGDDSNDVSIVKVEQGESFEQQKDKLSSASSRDFLASKVLKRLSEHYSESLKRSVHTLPSEKLDSVSTEFMEGEVFTSSTDAVDKTRCAAEAKRLCVPMVINEKEGRDIVKHNRQKSRGKNENVDYMCESDDSISNYSSDSDHKKNLVIRGRQKNIKKNKLIVQQRVCSHGNHSFVKHPGCDPLSKRQPQMQLNCLECSFSTCDRANMRHHLIDSHPGSIPFAEAIFKPEGKVMLYFCKGVNSKCTFLSSEGMEIFEHIKLCYFGHLDNFMDCAVDKHCDYSQVLLSLGIASKIIDSSPVSFYCLRCTFSKTNFQQVANHVATNHGKEVAGVLLVNKILVEPRVQMVCVTCNALMNAKQWSVHCCRMLKSSVVSQKPSSKYNTHLDDFEECNKVTYCQKGLPIKVGSGSIPNEKKTDKDKEPSKENGSSRGQSHMLGHIEVQSNNVKDTLKNVHIKQEPIFDDDLEEESVDDVPVHFSYTEKSEENVERNDSAYEANNISRNGDVDLIDLSMKKAPARVSVLQNLLTAPKEVGIKVPKSFSLLENLLNPLNSLNVNGQPLPLMNSAQNTPALAVPFSKQSHTQHPKMREILSQKSRIMHHFSASPLAEKKKSKKDYKT